MDNSALDAFEPTIREYQQKTQKLVDENYNEAYLESVGDPETVIKKEFPEHAWREFYYGVLGPNRQATLIYEQGDPYHRDRDLIVGINKQIRDEVKHSRIFSNLVARFGVTFDLVTWEPNSYEDVVAKGRATVDHNKPHHIAAAFQCGTETLALYMIKNLADFIASDYPDIADTLRANMVADEGDHIEVGKLIIARFASPDEVDEMREITRRKYEASRRVLEHGFNKY